MLFIKSTETYKIIKNNIPSRNWMKVAIFIIDVLNIYLSTYIVVCMQKLIDSVTESSNTGDFSLFKTTVLLTLFVILINTFVVIFKSIFSFYATKDFVSNLTKFIFESFYKQGFLFTKNNDSGVVASKLMSETPEIATWLLGGVLSIYEDIVNCAIKYAVLYKYSPLLSVICISFVTIAFAATRSLNHKLALINKQVYAAGSELMQFFVQASNSFVDVKQLSKEKTFVNNMLNILHNQIYFYKQKALYLDLLYSSIFSISGSIFPMAVLIGGLYFTLKGQLSVGKTIAMYTIVKMAQAPLSALADDISSWKSMMILTERLDCFMPPKDEDESGKVDLEKVDNITFDCKKFSYSGADEILKGVNFKINNGDIFCIKGRTGVGKTTISSLLMRFNKLEEPSSLKLNGVDINKYSYKSFYKNVNILNQVPYIFQDSLLNNITMGDEYPEEFLNEVIETAQLTKFVEQYGMDYILQEDANNISGGQKQRIGLARLLLRKPQVLILDEPTAALDEKTSASLVHALEKFKNKYGMTIVIITHSMIFDNVATQILDLNTYSENKSS